MYSKQNCFLIAFHSAAAAKSLVIQVSSHTSNCTSAKWVGDTITLQTREDKNPFILTHLKPSEHCVIQMQPEMRKLLRFVWLLLEKTQPGDGDGGGLETELRQVSSRGIATDASGQEWGVFKDHLSCSRQDQWLGTRLYRKVFGFIAQAFPTPKHEQR